MIALFDFITGHLIEIMGAVLCTALILRFIAYKTGQQNWVYFDTFSGSIEKILHGEESQIILSLEKKLKKQIVIYPNHRFHIEEFDIFEILKS